MIASHKRGAGGRQNIRPNVVARTSSEIYYVMSREVMFDGDPKLMVCRGAQQGDGVALFWDEVDAIHYCEWRNEKVT